MAERGGAGDVFDVDGGAEPPAKRQGRGVALPAWLRGVDDAGGEAESGAGVRRAWPGPLGQLRGNATILEPDAGTGAVRELELGGGGDSQDEAWAGAPWLCALQELGAPPFGATPLPYCVRWVQCEGYWRVTPQLLVLVAQLTVHDGDATAVLRDPTGAMQAVVHREVVDAGLAVGAVLLLRDVAVFNASRTQRYINVVRETIARRIDAGDVPHSATALPPMYQPVGIYARVPTRVKRPSSSKKGKSAPRGEPAGAARTVARQGQNVPHNAGRAQRSVHDVIVPTRGGTGEPAKFTAPRMPAAMPAAMPSVMQPPPPPPSQQPGVNLFQQAFRELAAQPPRAVAAPPPPQPAPVAAPPFAPRVTAPAAPVSASALMGSTAFTDDLQLEDDGALDDWMAAVDVDALVGKRAQ